MLVGESIDGVTDITYSYANDYPRRIGASMGASTGPSRDITRAYERGMWLSNETFEEGGDALVRTFGDWDAYGTPRSAVATLNSVEQSRYKTTTDARGRVATVAVETLGTAVGTVSYDYAANGQIAGVSVAGGMFATSGFEYHRTAGRITEIVQTGTSDVLAAFSAPDPMGRATQIDLPTATVTLSWDTMGRISALGVDNGTDELERAYVYDGRGRLASLQRTLNGTPERTEEYVYAEPGWLVGETKWAGTGSEEALEYVHDAAGNRTERNNLTDLTSTTYAYGDGNRLVEVDSVAVTWDAYGGMTEDHRGWGLIRGPDGAELALEDPSNVGVYELVRDALGRQVAVLDADASFTVWGNPEADLPLVTLDESGATVLNVAAEGLLLGQLRDDVAKEAVSDLAGSLIAFDGELLELPGAFGDDAVAQTTGTGTERHVYAGLAMLPEAPYQLARQRLYDPELGRFASMDPIGLEATGGNCQPVMHADGQPQADKRWPGGEEITITARRDETDAEDFVPDGSMPGRGYGGSGPAISDMFGASFVGGDALHAYLERAVAAGSTGAGEHRGAMSKGQDDFGLEEEAGLMDAREAPSSPSPEPSYRRNPTRNPGATEVLDLAAPTIAANVLKGAQHTATSPFLGQYWYTPWVPQWLSGWEDAAAYPFRDGDATAPFIAAATIVVAGELLLDPLNAAGPGGAGTKAERVLASHADELIDAARVAAREVVEAASKGLPSNADDLLERGYRETSHPKAAGAGHRSFENPETGDALRFDKGKPGRPGHAGKDHYHRPNPNATGKQDAYLDADGNPVPDGSDPSHLYP